MYRLAELQRPARAPGRRTEQPTAARGHLLSLADLSPPQIRGVIDTAAALKRARRVGLEEAKPLSGRAVALLFERPSLRTRVSLEVGLARMGATPVVLAGSEVGFGEREAVADLARSLSRYVEAICARVVRHAVLRELADAATVPVVNALTDREHPLQALADLQTLEERFDRLAGRRLAWVGDGNNVCHSLLLGAAALGLDMSVATPAAHRPAAEIVAEAMVLAERSGARIELVEDPVAAVAGADAIYTDTWASIGSDGEGAARRAAFEPYRVTSRLAAHAPYALIMHCMPAHRGQEIEAALLDGPASLALDQAENRLYVQQATLLHLVGGA